MPEARLHFELEALNSSLYTLDINFVELEKFIVELTTDAKWDYVFQVENREALQSVSREIIRRLHNFVAAAMSLREHALATFNSRYSDKGLMPDYEERVKAVFGSDPLAQFVMGLRKYCQHYRSPFIGFVTHWEHQSDSTQRTAVIFKEDLASFAKWPGPARAYISSLDRGVEIVPLCREYRAKVLKFYEWFQLQQNEIHRDELARFEEKEAQLLRLQLEDMLDRCIASRDDLRCSEQALFFHIFLMGDYQILADQASLPARAEEAIRLLEHRFPIGDTLKNKIRIAYSVPGFRVYLSRKSRPESPAGPQAPPGSAQQLDGADPASCGKTDLSYYLSAGRAAHLEAVRPPRARDTDRCVHQGCSRAWTSSCVLTNWCFGLALPARPFEQGQCSASYTCVVPCS